MEPSSAPAGLGAAKGLEPQPEGAEETRAALPFLAWSAVEVAEWVVRLGFPQYEECFRANGITGRRLILVDCSRLPAIGVTDFGHMQGKWQFGGELHSELCGNYAAWTSEITAGFNSTVVVFQISKPPKEISRHVRELLGTEEPLFSRSVALPYRDSMGLFLERKSRSGKKADALTFSQFVQEAGLEPYATVPPLQPARAGVEADALPVSQSTQRQD